MGSCREVTIRPAEYFLNAIRRRNEHATTSPIGDHLGASDHPINTWNRHKAMSIEAKNPGAGIHPKRGIGCDKQSVDLAGARQSFRLTH
jgi:hypothetical protein